MVGHRTATCGSRPAIHVAVRQGTGGLQIFEPIESSQLGDGDAEQKLCSIDDAVYWQQLSEVLLAHRLTRFGVRLAHHQIGPDFLLESDGKRIWVEVIYPELRGVPATWLNAQSGEAYSLPHEAILLRWTPT